MKPFSCHALECSIAGKRVAAGLDLEMLPGQFWGLLGANGVGKTTLLRCLAGLHPPSSGTVSFDGRPLDEWPRRELARELSMLQQHTYYVFEATVEQVALTGRHPYLGRWESESAADRERARAALADVYLDRLASRTVTSLSGGEARRLAFAALMVQDPRVLLLDEPTNHLDFRHQVGIMRRVGDLVYSEERIALAALHDVNLAATYCSHVLLLHGDGRWQAGSATALLTVENLAELYDCPVSAVETPEGRRFHPSFSGRSA